MYAQSYRLTTKDVRYIQKQKNIIWTKYFGCLWIRQYPNRRYHQCSLYLAADTIRKSVRRHQLKRQLLAQLPASLTQPIGSGFFKFFIFLNKKNLNPDQFGRTASERQKMITILRDDMTITRSRIIQHLSK